MQMGDKNPIIGKEVVAVYRASDDKALRFDTEDGEEIIARAEGGCCSSTWVESMDAPDLLVGETVRNIDTLYMDNPPNQPDYGEVKQYGCVIITTGGRCVIEYRNKSNGYYGGSIKWPHQRYYPGVYSQNESNEDWRLVATDE